ncbi:MAG: DUF1592 domain-containing protein [Fuerstiella sp.]|nr:DUF1592 domain-containing protein [Fuerstiella sp.]
MSRYFSEPTAKPRWVHVALLCVALIIGLHTRLIAAGPEFPEDVAPLLNEFCLNCHDDQHSEAKVNFTQLVSNPDFATHFRTWRTARKMIEQGRMPPKGAPQPGELQREQLLGGIRRQLQQVTTQHARDPGPVVLRRLTSAEYAYTIHDLTGVALIPQADITGDAVGGEGFANVGTVQFMQDSTLERYLDAAKHVAAHAVIGTGPLMFYKDPGRTGLELSAISRIQKIYRDHGFRTAAGEGGEAFGLDRYAKGFYATWRYRYRRQHGIGDRTLAELAAEEGIDTRFAEYLWALLNRPAFSFPTSDIAMRWQNLTASAAGVPVRQFSGNIRRQCEQIQQVMLNWQNRLGQNPDAKEEAPVLSAGRFDVDRSKRFEMNINWPKGTSTAHIQLKVESANRDGNPRAVVIWRSADIQFRDPDRRLTDPEPLSALIPGQGADRPDFGRSVAGAKVGPHDFVTVGTMQTSVFELPVRKGATSARLTVTAVIDVQHGDDCIVRCTIAQQEETGQGQQVSALLANSKGTAFREWKDGVLDFARLLPQVSHGEPAPSDRDPIPSVFDNTYNNAERNFYHYRIKYYRNDSFLVDSVLDDRTRRKLDQAWMDLLGSFEYHDTYLGFIADKHSVELRSRRIAELDPAYVDRFSAEPRVKVRLLQHSHQEIQNALVSAESGHVADILKFARRAWRRPLVPEERNRLRLYYGHLRESEQLDHHSAVRTLLTRILTAPEFLYRTEHQRGDGEIRLPGVRAVPLSDWELATRLSYFLWSSLPDDNLRGHAAAGTLSRPAQLTAQVRRMLKDPRARRLATEFFGQWFGFYRFNRYRGVDPKRFPEFTDSLKADMHDEAVSFFAHVVRNNRPVSDILFADYTFLNARLAEHYSVAAADLSDQLVLVGNLAGQHRGGLMGLGAVLTVTSAPLRTSPVKRGDWVLRRIMGTPVPPPPADAGSLPGEDVLADGLTVRARLEAHRSDASCLNCHSRIDPLGFALEQYDTLGRWRETYRDGQTIQTSGKLYDDSLISGTDGLRAHLKKQEHLFQRTLCTKLVGYALGRRESISDVQLIEQLMVGISDDDRFSALVERLVHSRQFRYRRSVSDPSTDTGKPNE